MKMIVVGAVVAGGLFFGLRAAVRHCQTMPAEHCGTAEGHSCSCT